MHPTHTDASCKSGARRPLQLHRHGMFIHRARLMQRRTSAGSWSQGNLHAWRNTPYFIICVLSHFDVRQCCWADAAWEEPIFQILRHIGNIIMAGLNGLDTFSLTASQIINKKTVQMERGGLDHMLIDFEYTS